MIANHLSRLQKPANDRRELEIEENFMMSNYFKETSNYPGIMI